MDARTCTRMRSMGKPIEFDHHAWLRKEVTGERKKTHTLIDVARGYSIRADLLKKRRRDYIDGFTDKTMITALQV